MDMADGSGIRPFPKTMSSHATVVQDIASAHLCEHLIPLEFPFALIKYQRCRPVCQKLRIWSFDPPFQISTLNHSILLSASTKSKLPNIMFYTFVLIFGQTGGGDCNVHDLPQFL
jgi:hypothetical protein